MRPMNTQHSPDFVAALAFVLRWEGGYVHDPADPGGETKYGVSKRAYPSLDIAALTEEAAAEIYWRDYWLAGHCDLLPWPLSLGLFDGRVNLRPSIPAILLQRLLGVRADGIVGPATAAAAHGLTPEARAAVWERYCDARERHYRDIAAARTRSARFLAGWLNRVASLRRRGRRGVEG